jgi:hypothetical protein
MLLKFFKQDLILISSTVFITEFIQLLFWIWKLLIFSRHWKHLVSVPSLESKTNCFPHKIIFLWSTCTSIKRMRMSRSTLASIPIQVFYSVSYNIQYKCTVHLNGAGFQTEFKRTLSKPTPTRKKRNLKINDLHAEGVL